MGRKPNVMMVMMGVTVALVAIIVYLTQGYATSLNIDDSIGSGLATVFPGMLITVMGILAIRQTENSPMSIGSYGAVGIGLVVLLGELYTASIITEDILDPATITQVQTLVMVVMLLIGGFVSARRR